MFLCKACHDSHMDMNYNFQMPHTHYVVRLHSCGCLLQENFLASLDSHQLDIDTSDVTLGTLSKAFK